jgi:hypothetical protein
MRVALFNFSGPPDQLIQNACGVVRNPVPYEQPEVFAREAILSVVRFLVANVVTQVAVFEGRYREGTVAVLPFKVAAVWKGVVNPFGRGCFDTLHQVRQGDGTGWLQVQMDVVSGATGAQQFSPASINDGGGARKEA